VWQRALDLAVEGARLAPALAAAGHDAAGADLVRAGAAVPAHIAAGGAAATRLEHQRVLHLALAAVARFETLVALAERLAPERAAQCAAVLAGTSDVSRQLRAFTRAIGGSPANARPGARPDASRTSRELDATDPPRPEPAADAHPTTTTTPRPNGGASGAPSPDAPFAGASAAAPAADTPPPAAFGADAMTPITPPMPARAARARRTRTARP
jgi:four helix bundle protein